MPKQIHELASSEDGGRTDTEKHTEIHDMIAANGAVVYDDVPGPERDSIPLAKSQLQLNPSQDCGGHAFLTSKRGFLLSPSAAAPLFFFTTGAAAGASVMSTSAIFQG